MACRWCGFFSKPGGACDVCGSPLPKDAPVVSAAVARDALITRAEPISVLEDHHPPAELPSLDDLVLDARDIPEVVFEPPLLPREVPLPDVVTGEEQLIWSLEREPEGPDGAQVPFGEIARGWPVEALRDRDHVPGGTIPGAQDPFVEFDAAEPLDGPFARQEGPSLPLPPVVVESAEPPFEIDLPLDLQPEPSVDIGPSLPWPPAAPEVHPTPTAGPSLPWPPAAPEARALEDDAANAQPPLDGWKLAGFVEFDAEEPFRGPILRVPEASATLESQMPEPQDYVGFEDGELWTGAAPIEPGGETQGEAQPSAPLARGAVLRELASLTGGDEMEPEVEETLRLGRPTQKRSRASRRI